MMSRQQMIGVPVSISDWVGCGPKDFWAVMRDRMSAWVKDAIQAVLEHEIEAFAGAGWHQRVPEGRRTYRCGYRKRLSAVAAVWRPFEPRAVAVLEADFEQTLGFLTVPREHRRWVTTTNPLERHIREVRRRTRPMGTFQGFGSCRRLIYVGIKKLSDQRRNAIPYSLWTSQPWYGHARRSRRQRRCHLERLEKTFWKEFAVS